MAEIDLGFAEECGPGWLTNRYFPNKLGGKPAWLELEKLPSTEQLQCPICKEQKAFLCQLYAPFDDEFNFHRTLYVFICRTPECSKPNSAENLSIFRSQLPRYNDFYSSEPPDEDNEGEALPPIIRKRLCTVCGLPGPYSCVRCKTDYCSAKHQKAHWPHHKKFCKNGVPSQDVPIPSIVFEEMEIVVEPYDETKAIEKPLDGEAEEKARLKDYEKLVAEGKTGALQDVPDSEIDNYAKDVEIDKFFNKFKKEVDKDPEQIVRYKRNGKPLWIADVNKTIEEQLKNIPNCENCGGERQFEFQIMPQMLLQLKDTNLDWGVLVFYTCAKSCAISNDKGYLPEFVLKQDISSDNN